MEHHRKKRGLKGAHGEINLKAQVQEAISQVPDGGITSLNAQNRRSGSQLLRNPRILEKLSCGATLERSLSRVLGIWVKATRRALAYTSVPSNTWKWPGNREELDNN